jgi:CheY-like chemotaxis protein
MHHRILVADDDKNLRRVVGELLEDAGYAVEVAADGEEALAAIDRGVPALLLLDVRMPRLDGIAVLERLRQRSPSFPVIVITAQEDAGLAAVERGAARVLVKPLSLDGLLEAVRATI